MALYLTRRGLWLLVLLAVPPVLLFVLFALIVMLAWLYAVTAGGVEPGSLVMDVRAPTPLSALLGVGVCVGAMAGLAWLLSRARRVLAASGSPNGGA